DDYLPALGAEEAGDRVDQRGLAGARAAKERGQAAGALERGVEDKAAEMVLDRDLEHVKVPGRGASPARSAPRRRAARRAKSLSTQPSDEMRRDRRPGPGSAHGSRSASAGFGRGLS